MNRYTSHLRSIALALPVLLAGCAGTPRAPAPQQAAAPVALPRYSASFDCNGAANPVQEAVCLDAGLAQQDRTMDAIYRSRLRNIDLPDRTHIMAYHRQWVATLGTQCNIPPTEVRNVAPEPAQRDCLQAGYRDHIANLTQLPQPPVRARAKDQSHPVSAYLEYNLVDATEPALCASLGQRFNESIAERGDVIPAQIAGLSAIAGSHGPADSGQLGARKIAVTLYDAGRFASYQMRAKDLRLDGNVAADDTLLASWIAKLPNSGGNFTTTSSQTRDLGAIDVFTIDARPMVLVSETWGYYAAASRGESPHAGVYEIGEQGLTPRCLFRTYLTPPVAKAFDKLPSYKALASALLEMAGDPPRALPPIERQDDVLLRGEALWTMFNLPLVVLDQVQRQERLPGLRRWHDDALETLFTWSERNVQTKQLYRRLLPLMQPAHAELARALQAAEGLKPNEALAAADLLLMEIVAQGVQNLFDPNAVPKPPATTSSDYIPRYAVAPTPGDLEKGRRLSGLHSAVLNNAPAKVIADFVQFELGSREKMLGRGAAGDTVLMAAVANPGTVQQLLAQGENVNASNDWGKTPLMAAAQIGQLATVQILLQAGAEAGRTTVAWHADGAGMLDNQEGAVAGRTALTYAAAKGSEAVVRLLLEQGAALAQRDSDGRIACAYIPRNATGPEATAQALSELLCARP